jgi:hypothetical protein
VSISSWPCSVQILTAGLALYFSNCPRKITITIIEVPDSPQPVGFPWHQAGVPGQVIAAVAGRVPTGLEVCNRGISEGTPGAGICDPNRFRASVWDLASKTSVEDAPTASALRGRWGIPYNPPRSVRDYTKAFPADMPRDSRSRLNGM